MVTRPADADGRPSVHVPTSRDDQPSWRKVGAIAAVGFVVGVAWPRIAGIRLGPSVPDGASSAVPSAESAPAPPPQGAPGTQRTALPAEVQSAAPSSPAVPAATASSGAPVGPSESEFLEVVVGHGSVVSCETSDGSTLKAAQCGGLAGLDAIVMPRLRRLTKCKALPSLSASRLRFEVTVDFVRGNVAIDWARARTSAAAESVLACARAELSGASVASMDHDHPRYTATYSIGLDARRSAAAAVSASPSPVAAISAPAPSVSPAGDTAVQVEWEVAIVRDTPKTGKIVARLQRGATVRIGPPKDGWYPVKYGDGYTGAGWVYRGALGR
jgi:hypothetical protein